MKNLEEKKLLVKMARMLGEEVDPALLESIEREEKLASVFFGAPAPEPKAPPIPILKEDLPQPEEAIVEEPAIQQLANTAPVVPKPAESKPHPYRDKEMEGIRKQIAEMMQKISAMSWGTKNGGGGGGGIVRIGDADDFDRATYGEGKYLTWSDGYFRLVASAGGSGAQGAQGFQGVAGSGTGGGGDSNWILKTANYTANSGDRIIADTSNGQITITLPASPSTGNAVTIIDGNDWSANSLFVARNGSTIEGIADDLGVTNRGVIVSLVYNGSPGVNTWQVASTLGLIGPQGPSGFGTVNTTVITSSTYTVSANDYYIGVNYAGNVTITNPVSTNGRMIVIKDESGNCSNNPIIVAGTIDNDAGGFNLQIDNGAVNMVYRSGWRIV